MARLAAERRLKDAQERLGHLEQGIHDHGSVDKHLKEDQRKEMIGDVKAIRSKVHFAANFVNCQYTFLHDTCGALITVYISS